MRIKLINSTSVWQQNEYHFVKDKGNGNLWHGAKPMVQKPEASKGNIMPSIIGIVL